VKRKSKKSDYRLTIICIVFIIFIALFLPEYLIKDPFVNLAAKIILCAAIGFLLVTKIYLPIKTIEKTIHVLNEGNFKEINMIEEKNDRDQLSNNLNNILKNLKETLDREYLAKYLKKQAEINALQSQINPHFLYNTLDSIRGQALLEGSKEIAAMIETLSILFRYNINKGGNLVSFEEELKNIDNYLKIQQYRFDNKFEIEKNIDYDDAYLMHARLPKLTLQPVIENAIFHGLECKIGQGKITIRAFATKKRMIINISDNGVGMSSEELEAISDKLNADIKLDLEDNRLIGTGIALTNVNQRIKLSFGEQYGLTMYSTVGYGTTVEIVLPLIHESVGKENKA
jgi:Predicted signal transduction protein with a C-terminal ATPase domain